MTQLCETHQKRHDEFVQVNHLNAAHAQLHSAVSFAGVGVTGTLCGIRSQTHGKAEHLITHDGDGLKDKKNNNRYSTGLQRQRTESIQGSLIIIIIITIITTIIIIIIIHLFSIALFRVYKDTLQVKKQKCKNNNKYKERDKLYLKSNFKKVSFGEVFKRY